MRKGVGQRGREGGMETVKEEDDGVGSGAGRQRGGETKRQRYANSVLTTLCGTRSE